MREQWFHQIAQQPCDGILIGGDIAESGDVVCYLQQLAKRISVPIYFVLGNHDFYGSSIGVTGQHVVRACRETPQLHYLTDLSAISLSRSSELGRVYLVGEDGWGDASEGDYHGSYVRLNDFQRILDFSQHDQSQWRSKLQQLGRSCADRLWAKLCEIPADATHVLVLTHVPPFREACWYEGRTTDDHWAPFFVCGQVGQAIRQISQSRPDCQFTVLCGHTHHAGMARLEPNLTIHTGSATYGEPDVTGIILMTSRGVSVQR
jgi:predicted phosphohydrolase